MPLGMGCATPFWGGGILTTLLPTNYPTTWEFVVNRFVVYLAVVSDLVGEFCVYVASCVYEREIVFWVMVDIKAPSFVDFVKGGHLIFNFHTKGSLIDKREIGK